MMVVVLATPQLFFGLSWAMLGNENAGLINYTIRTVTGTSWSPFNVESWFGIIFVLTLKVTAFGYLLMIGPFGSMDRTLEEASRTSGASAVSTFFRVTIPVLTPAVAGVVGVVKVMLDRFDGHEIDQLQIVSNSFINTMTQQPVIEQLLPLLPSEEEDLKHHWDYLYEPEAKELLDGLLDRYIESQVYQAVVENNACEQAARMIAMKSATDNAENMIKDLTLESNKVRQAAITSELLEITTAMKAME